MTDVSADGLVETGTLRRQFDPGNRRRRVNSMVREYCWPSRSLGGPGSPHGAGSSTDPRKQLGWLWGRTAEFGIRASSVASDFRLPMTGDTTYVYGGARPATRIWIRI